MSTHYVLTKDKKVKGCGLKEWAAFYEQTDSRKIARTVVGKVVISTVFLGIDHGFDGGKPVLFETMVFGIDDDELQYRYCTWDKAVKGHNIVVDEVRKELSIRKMI
jgi:hypothetical protein